MDSSTALRIAGSAFAVLLVGGTTAAAIPQAMRGTSTSIMTVPTGTTTLVLAQDVDTEVTGVEGTGGKLVAEKRWSFKEPEIRFMGPDAQGVTTVSWNCNQLPGTPACVVKARYTLPRTMNIQYYGGSHTAWNTVRINAMTSRIDVHNAATLNLEHSQPTKLNLSHVNSFFSRGLTQPPGATWVFNGSSMNLELTDLRSYALKTPGPYSPNRTFTRSGTPGEITMRGVNYNNILLTNTADKYQCQFNGDGVRTACLQLPAVLPNPWDGLPLNLPRVSAAPAT